MEDHVLGIQAPTNEERRLVAGSLTNGKTSQAHNKISKNKDKVVSFSQR